MEATAVTTTERDRAPGTPSLERNDRATRWFHFGIYASTSVLLATGWWLLAGREGQPTPLAQIFRLTDVELHEYAGWALTVVGVIGAGIGWRATRTFLAGSVRFDRADLTWFKRWPGALLSGRFARHRGHFDPGQRIVNLVIVVALGALIVSGFGLVAVSGGPAFVWWVRIHKLATYVVTAAIVGHVVVGAGLFPGYRGVWRAIHGRGRVSADLAHRLWPAWAATHDDQAARRDATVSERP